MSATCCYWFRKSAALLCMRTFAFSSALSSSQWWHKHFCGCVVSWWGNYLLEKESFVGLVFVWNSSLTWLSKQLYKWLCHCNGGKGWRCSCVMGKGLLLFTSALDHSSLLCLLLCPQSNPPRPELTPYLNLTPSSKKNLLSNKILVIQNSQLRLLRSLKNTSKVVL